MTHRRLLAVLGLVALCRLGLPGGARAQTAPPRKRQATTNKMAIGQGTETLDQPNAHVTQNLRKTRQAQRNLTGSPQARVQPAPKAHRATTRPAPRSGESLH